MKRKYSMGTLYKVLKEYNLSEKDVVIINEPKIDKVWVLHDTKNERWLVLKRLEKYKNHFAILLHHLLSEQGFSVPEVFKTTSGQIYVHRLNRCFYVSEYINDLGVISNQQRIKALAEFHLHAKFSELRSLEGITPFPTKQVFLKNYTNKLDEIKEWASSIQSSILKDTIRDILQLGREVCHLMEKYDLEEYLQKMSKQNTICHGDFNMNNAFTAKNGNFLIIDFDLAYFGPPMEDFRFLMMSLVRNATASAIDDPLSTLNPLFEHYFKVCSEYLPYKDIYKTDLMFPHEFYMQAKQIINQKNVEELDNQEEFLVKIAELDKNKYNFLLKGSEYF